MASVRVTITEAPGGYATFGRIMKSDAISDALSPLADAVLQAAQEDPNPTYVAGLRKVRHVSGGPHGRTSWRVGAAPVIGERVEAKRGTLARAIGRIG